MCEHEHVGCPNCGARTDHIVWREYQTEVLHYRLDSEGNTDPDYEAEFEGDYLHEPLDYWCESCDWRGNSLNPAYVDEDCECEECMGAVPQDPGPDPDRIVVFRRTQDRTVDLHKIFGREPPPEFKRLWEKRENWFQPVPRWRAAELYSEFLETLGVEVPIVLDFDFQLPDEDAYKLILPGFDPTKHNYKGAPDG